MVARHLRPQLRKQILNLPVTHDSCFGEDFSKSTENILKEQAAIEKIIKKPATQRLSYSIRANHSAKNEQCWAALLQFVTALPLPLFAINYNGVTVTVTF